MAMSKVLIVDDDIQFVNILSEEMVSYCQYEVHAATEKDAAVAALKQGGITIVLLDIDSGHIDGVDFLSFMTTSYPRTPVIVMTRKNHLKVQEINRSLQGGGVFCYMQKPSRLQVIGTKILEGLHQSDENDFVPGITLAGLMHLLKQAGITARIHLKSANGKQGYMDFDSGNLLDAVTDELEGQECLEKMISWYPASFQAEKLPIGAVKPPINPQWLASLLSTTSNSSSISVDPYGLTGDSSEFDMEKKVKLLIVDDSRMMRKAIAGIFADDDTVEVVGEAANGEEVLRILPEVKPDVITLDVQMPVMDGVTALKHIMIRSPTPTVMLSAFTREGAAVTFDALKYGAVDFVAKPSNVGRRNFEEQAMEISSKVHLAAEVELEAVRYIRTSKKNNSTGKYGRSDLKWLVVMGAAEGGYGSLLKIIPHLSPDLSAAYLVVLYADPEHVDAFVEFLNQCSSIVVRRAKNAEVLQGGVCYVASGKEYLTVHQGASGLVQHLSSAPFTSLRGSINMLMFSAAETMKENALGIILSGLGEDGKEGLEEIIRVGGSGVVQNPTSCPYKEMVRAALKRSPGAQVLTDNKIAPQIMSSRLFNA